MLRRYDATKTKSEMAEEIALAVLGKVTKAAVKREQKRRLFLKERPLYHRRSAPTGGQGRSRSSERKRHLSAGSSSSEHERFLSHGRISTSPSLDMERVTPSPAMRAKRKTSLLLQHAGSPLQSDDEEEDDMETAVTALVPQSPPTTNGHFERFGPESPANITLQVSFLIPEDEDKTSLKTKEYHIPRLPPESGHLMTAEDVAISCGRELGIPSRWFPLFSLFCPEQRLWLPPDFKEFANLMWNATDYLLDLEFRVRMGLRCPQPGDTSPHPHQQTATIGHLPDKVLQYLYYQLKHDFCSGRIHGNLDYEDDFQGDGATLCEMAISAKNRPRKANSKRGKTSFGSNSEEASNHRSQSAILYRIKCLSLAALSLYHEKPADLEIKQYLRRLKKNGDIKRNLPSFTLLDDAKWFLIGPNSKDLVGQGFQVIESSKMSQRLVELEYLSRVLLLCSPFEERYPIFQSDGTGPKAASPLDTISHYDQDEEEKEVLVYLKLNDAYPIVNINGQEISVIDVLRIEVHDKTVQLFINPKDFFLEFESRFFAESFAALLNSYAMYSPRPDSPYSLCVHETHGASRYFSALNAIQCQVYLPQKERKRLFFQSRFSTGFQGYVFMEDEAVIGRILLLRMQADLPSKWVEYCPDSGMWKSSLVNDPKPDLRNVTNELLKKEFSKEGHRNICPPRNSHPLALFYSSPSSKIIKSAAKVFTAFEVEWDERTEKKEEGEYLMFQKSVEVNGVIVDAVIKQVKQACSRNNIEQKRSQAIVEWMNQSGRPESLLLAYGHCLCPFSLVLEAAAFETSLNDWFVNNNSNAPFAASFGAPVTPDVCDQIGRALHFLASKKIHHGGVCASAVKVCGSNISDYYRACASGSPVQRPFVSVKLSDPGFTSTQWKQLLPWTPPELWREVQDSAVDEAARDVWAYGTFLWQVFNQCVKAPNVAMNCSSKEDAMNFLRNNNLPPPQAPDKQFEDTWDRGFKVMEQCWERSPSSRPKMNAIYEAFWRFVLHKGNMKEFESFMTMVKDPPTTPGLKGFGPYIFDGDDESSRGPVDVGMGTQQKLVLTVRDGQGQGHRQIDLERIGKEPLGKGHFGLVCLARISFADPKEEKICAVKTFNHRMSDKGIKTEMDTGLLIPQHPNIVDVIGTILDDRYGMMILFEYLEGKSLEGFLRERKETGTWDEIECMELVSHVCEGMAHLHSNGVLHRDLAVRNILLSSRTQPIVAKVGDFGLSRVTAENRYYYKRDGSGDTPLPEYMYPPETLGSSEKKFYPEGDVWSFGQLLYEVFNQKFNTEIHKAFELKGGKSGVLKGEVLDQPKGCSDLIYNKLILPCWKFERKERPVFWDNDNSVSRPTLRELVRELMEALKCHGGSVTGQSENGDVREGGADGALVVS